MFFVTFHLTFALDLINNLEKYLIFLTPRLFALWVWRKTDKVQQSASNIS
jgi:hypothetical protein